MSYQRINWQNKPSTETPLNAENLNHMDNAIATLDSDVSDLQTSQANQDSDIEALNSDVSTLQNNKQALLDKGTAQATDFNNITDVGWYRIDKDITTTNAPISGYGSLEVFCSHFLTQRFTTYENNEVYVRQYANDMWYNWHKILTTEIQLLENTDVNLALLNNHKATTYSRYEITNGLAERLGLPNEWFHIINLGRKYGNGYTTQIAVRIGNPGIWMGTSNSENFLDWNKVGGGGYKQAPQVNADYFDVLSDYQNAIWIEGHTAHLVVWLIANQDVPAHTAIITIPGDMRPSALDAVFINFWTPTEGFATSTFGLYDRLYCDGLIT